MYRLIVDQQTAPGARRAGDAGGCGLPPPGGLHLIYIYIYTYVYIYIYIYIGICIGIGIICTTCIRIIVIIRIIFCIVIIIIIIIIVHQVAYMWFSQLWLETVNAGRPAAKAVIFIINSYYY